jgi:hypothetical protein
LNPSAVCYSNENEKLVLNSKHLNDYLETKNIELFVLSKKYYVFEEIKRFEIEKGFLKCLILSVC